MTARPHIPVSHVTAVVIGNALEFYDFLTYALYATYIGNAFFPAHAASSRLLLSLATFGVGFLTRPVGGIVIGRLGDRYGRKPAMLLSFFLMGAGMLGLALTPSYAQIGFAAPILVLACRLIQGFALGGEVGPSTAYLIEAAPPELRGLYGTMQLTSQRASTLVAAIVGVALSSVLSAHALQDWGWRVAFLLGVAVVPFGLWIRRNLPETLHAADDAALAPDATRGTLALSARLRPYLRVIVCGFALLSSATIGIYVITYMTTYALNTLHKSAAVSLGVTIVTSLVGVIGHPLSGWLSDRMGRRPVMILPGLLMIAAILPAFWCIVHFSSTLVLYTAMGVVTLLFSLSTAPTIVALSESVPREIRSGATATVYAFAISIFGGSAQFLVAWLTDVTGNPLAPAWYWTAAAAFGIVAMLAIPESAPVKRRGASEMTAWDSSFR
jgi:MFS family permease